MLHYESYIPSDARDGAPLLVLLHGRGSNEQDLMGLQPHLPQGVIVVSPRAPFSGMPWGYGPGWAWYRFLGEDRPEPESFEAAQGELGEFLRELPGALPVKPGALTLGGFSQGGTMSLAYALRNPGVVPGVLNLSGFLANHPSVSATPETVRGTRIFWGHGTADGNIPWELAQAGRAKLEAAGADLEARDYRMGHTISGEELADAIRWAGWEG
ncbi:MAG: alpha/beta fold hydrolase [Gemmatimonadetes bacterium]|nr:alpha/beta fold hydrolase [Gemmatimonadota bacterium]